MKAFLLITSGPPGLAMGILCGLIIEHLTQAHLEISRVIIVGSVIGTGSGLILGWSTQWILSQLGKFSYRQLNKISG